MFVDILFFLKDDPGKLLQDMAGSAEEEFQITNSTVVINQVLKKLDTTLENYQLNPKPVEQCNKG